MRIVFLLIALLSFAITLHSQTPKVLRIDPSFASGSPAATIYEEVHYIPLETTRQSLFGAVNQMEVTDSLYIILDRSTNSILFFDKKGKFQTKISGRGRDIRSFKLEKEKNRIQVLQSNTNHLDQILKEKAQTDLTAANILLNRLIDVSYYNLNGKSIKVSAAEKQLTVFDLSSIDLPHGFSFSNFALAGENMADSQAYALNIFKNDRLYKSALPYQTSEDIARYGRYLNSAAGFTRSQNDTVVYFTQPMDYSVYEVSPHAIQQIYQLIFPAKYSFPRAFFTDPMSQNDRLIYFRDHPSLVTGLSDVYLFPNRLVFKINNNERNWNASNTFMYSLKSGDLFSLSRISPDSSTLFLPVADYGFGNESYKYLNDDYLYTQVSSRRMFQAYEANREKNLEYPAHLQQYFLKGDQKDNPVIVQLKPKSNF